MFSTLTILDCIPLGEAVFRKAIKAPDDHKLWEYILGGNYTYLNHRIASKPVVTMLVGEKLLFSFFMDDFEKVIKEARAVKASWKKAVSTSITSEQFRKSVNYIKWLKSFLVVGDIVYFTGTRSYPTRKIISFGPKTIYCEQLTDTMELTPDRLTTYNGYDKVLKIYNPSTKKFLPVKDIYEVVHGKGSWGK